MPCLTSIYICDELDAFKLGLFMFQQPSVFSFDFCSCGPVQDIDKMEVNNHKNNYKPIVICSERV